MRLTVHECDCRQDRKHAGSGWETQGKAATLHYSPQIRSQVFFYVGQKRSGRAALFGCPFSRALL